MSAEAVVTVHNLSKCYQVYDNPQDRLLQMLFRGKRQYFHEFWALNNVSFEVQPGETFGIIGRNGSGKSTLLQILAGTLAATSGDVNIQGRVAALLELGSGFNMEFTGRENIFLNGRILGLSKEEIENRYDDIVSFADIGEYINQPVKTYSSGMFVRLAFAVQAHIDANVIIIDEALAVGDIFFRQKCYARLEELKQRGTSILLVSHSMTDIEQYCERGLVLNCGNQEFVGTASEAVKKYYLLHQALQQASLEKVDVNPSLSIISNQSTMEGSTGFSDKSQISTGKALCKKIFLSDNQNNLSLNFHQGQEVVFHYEFELLDEDVEIPICGVVIKNDRGVIVHGKNAWQYSSDVPSSLGNHCKVIGQQTISLNLQPGEYTFEVAMASVTKELWQRRVLIPYDEIAPKFELICYVPDAGSFTVGFALQDGVSVLTHHGIADLPGHIAIQVIPATEENSGENSGSGYQSAVQHPIESDFKEGENLISH